MSILLMLTSVFHGNQTASDVLPLALAFSTMINATTLTEMLQIATIATMSKRGTHLRNRMTSGEKVVGRGRGR